MSIRELSLHSHSHPDSIWQICCSSNSMWSIGADDWCREWSSGVQLQRVASAHHVLQPTNNLPLSTSMANISLTVNQKYVITSSMEGSIHIYDRQEGNHIKTISCGPLETWGVSAHPLHANLVAAGTQKGHVNVWNIDSGEKVSLEGDKPKEGEEKGAWVMSVAYSPDGAYIAAGHFDGRVTLFHVESDSKYTFQSLPPHFKCVRALAFTIDSLHLYTGSDDMHIHCYDVLKGAQLKDVPAHGGWVTAVAVPPTQSPHTQPFFATAATDKKIRIWNANTHESFASIECDSAVWSLAFTPDGDKLIAGTEQGTIGVYQVSPQ